MLTVTFISESDLPMARGRIKRLLSLFITQPEQDAMVAFASRLSVHLRPGTAEDFVWACERAADDLADPTKVSEEYDGYTVRILRGMASVFAEEIFGNSFAKEVRDITYDR